MAFLSGKKVFEKEIIREQNTLEMDVSKWPAGLYYFRLVGAGSEPAPTSI
ncbi:MAG: hypothetical protein NTW10_15325 [Bacteroidetes bacterium]|nr:hypothetical protein [Bacteroidota bacterium]